MIAQQARRPDDEPRGCGRRRCTSLARRQILGHVCYAALEGDLAAGGVAGDNVRLGADYMEDDVGRQVASQLREPHAHLGEGLRVGDRVAEDAGVGAAVVEPGYRAEAFLAGWVGRVVSIGVYWVGDDKVREK